jgi:DNA replication and repair protein RecF
MILESLNLKNFRLHNDSHFDFSPKLNFLVGGNGQGKTTVLEAIYLICTTKSFKSSPDSEILNFESNFFEVTSSIKSFANHNIRIFYSKEENKRVYFKDGKQLSRAADIIGKFPVVVLTPADLEITHGYPADRRKFVDSVISQASELYLNILLDYNKTLKQRASLLNKLKEFRSKILFDELEAWDEKLINSGTELIVMRRRFIEEFKEYLLESYSHIIPSSRQEVPEIHYASFSTSNENLKQYFLTEIKNNRENEIRRGSNLVGPHKDDFIFKINGNALRTYGSQGQHKTFQVALKFAQFFFLKNILKNTPFFLLDDVFGELDKERSIAISDYLKEVGQAFITLTDFSNYEFLKKDANDKTIFLGLRYEV